MFAVSPACRGDPIQSLQVPIAGELSDGPQGLTQVRRTHEEQIDALDCRNRVSLVGRLGGFDLHRDEGLPVGAFMIIEKGCTLISVTNDVKLVTSGLAAVKESYSQLW